MLTEECVRETYRQSQGKEITDENLRAFLHFAAFFDCMDADSYEEAHKRICISTEMISDELECAGSEDEEAEILARRYKGFAESGEAIP